MISSQVESSAKCIVVSRRASAGGRRRRRWLWFHWCRGLEAQLVPGGKWEAEEGRESGLLRKHEGPAGHRVSKPSLKSSSEHTLAFPWNALWGTTWSGFSLKALLSAPWFLFEKPNNSSVIC